MFPLGLFGFLLGGYLVSSAVQNRAPIKTLTEIIRDPSNARTILQSNEGAFNSGGVTGLVGEIPGLSFGDSNPTVGTSAGAAATGSAATAIAYARAQIGKPYQWGAEGPNAFDCSGLTQKAMAAAGVKIPRTTSTQIFAGRPVSRDQLLPGDLVFANPGHVAIYSGNGNVIEAPRRGLPVREVRMWGFWRARRVL